MIGNLLTEVLTSIEDSLWDFESKQMGRPQFTDEGFRAAAKIFMCAMMDKMYWLQEKENMPMKDRCNMATKCGEALKDLVKTYSDIDTKVLYK